ncbi:hypothetical protein ACLKA7_007793 [Drosophila subpalustris]
MARRFGTELKGFPEEELALFEGLHGVSHIAEHTIRLKDDKPLKQRYYPKNPATQRMIDEQVNELIQAGAIEPSRSPHSAPIVLVKKKTGDWRMHRLPTAQCALYSGCLSCPSD